jgi:hypothetical protein
MKICLHCGAMISPYPMHKTEKGICADCHNETISMVASAMGVKEIPNHMLAKDEVDTGRPKIRGKHMVIQKSQAQILMEKRQRELGRRFY